MNLKTYTLSVSLASLIGLLVAIVPIVRHSLEYMSPSGETLTMAELYSPAARSLAQGRFDTAHEKTLHYLIAYGALFVVCGVMLAIHLRWGLRLSREKENPEEPARPT